MARIAWNKTHGMSNTSIFNTWWQMLARCNDPRVKDYKNYGGRGIRVCERWQHFSNFYTDMGDRPQGLTLERVNNDGNYEPSNCIWASRFDQSQNTSVVKRISHDGITLSMHQWAQRLGFNKAMLQYRIYYWGIEKALTTPRLRKRGRK